MKFILNNKWFSNVTLLTLCLLAIFARFYNLEKPFGYIDDTVIPMLVQDAKNIHTQGNPGTERIQERLEKYLNPEMASNLSKYAIDAYPFFAVSLSGLTYAPLQYTIYPLFITNEITYEEVKYRSRLPSLIFSSISILLFLLISIRAKGVADTFQIKILYLSLICFSLEQYIYSRWTLPYSAGVFCSTFISYILLVKGPEKTNFLLLGIILSLLCTLQYQTIFLLPGVFMYLFFYFNTFPTRKIIKAFITPLVTSTILYVIFLSSMQQPGITYNAGPNFEYLFNLNKNISLESIKYILTFFYENIPLAFATLFTPTDLNMNQAWYFGLLFFILWALGTYKMIFYSKDRKLMSYGIFSSTVFFTILMMVIFKIIALGPTRHFLIYLPIVSIPIAYFASSLQLNLYSNSIINFSLRWIPAAIGISLGLTFFWNLSEQNTKMQDTFDEAEVYNQLEKYQPDIILTSCALPIVLMPSITNKYPTIYDCGSKNIRWRNRINLQKKYTKIIYVSNVNELNEFEFKRISQLTEKKIGQQLINDNLSCWSINPLRIHNGLYTAEAFDFTNYAVGKNSFYMYEFTLENKC